MNVVAYVPDLMDCSKVAAAIPGVVIVRRPEDLAAAADADSAVIVDLSRPGVLDAVPALAHAGARVIGFGSHVEGDVLRAARQAGCAVVLARSAFFGHIAEVVGYPGS
jgi:hypothetical protein